MDPQSQDHSFFPWSEGEVHSQWPGHHGAVYGGYVHFYLACTSDQSQWWWPTSDRIHVRWGADPGDTGFMSRLYGHVVWPTQ